MTRRKIRVCGFGLIGVLAYTASAAAQGAPPPAPAPNTATVETHGAATVAVAPAAPPPAEPAPILAPAAPAAPPAPPADAAPPPPPPAAFVAPKLESPNATIKLGLLAQPQFEAVGSAAQSKGSYNLYVRRVRLLLGGTLFGKFDYFFDTDSPNLFKGDATGAKVGPGIIVQDIFVTYKPYEDYFKVDMGYMLPPLSHNAVQGATTLYGLDYFANTFRHAGVFGNANDIGRDAGLQLRGVVAGGHLEYRAGVFQGLRKAATATEVNARNIFRYAGRLQLNVFDPETAFFYSGTYLGKKKILSVGASYDFQDNYHHWSVDGFLDMPLGDDGITAQVNLVKWNGGDFLQNPPVAPATVPTARLPNQTAFMGEAGYRIGAVQLSPMVRFEYRNLPDAGVATNEARYGLGLAYWPFGHNVNLKAFYNRVQPKPAPHGYNQINLQWQLFFY